MQRRAPLFPRIVLTVAGWLALGSLHFAHAQSLGLVADNSTKSVTVFNADTDSVLGTVFLPQGQTPSSATGDCVITSDLTLGFVSDFQFRVWVLDLTASPPQLASGINPIPIANRAEDLVLTPDGQYLVACNGSNDQPVALIDIALRQQVASYNTDGDTNTIDVCPDGSILVSSITQRLTRRLTIEEGASGVFLQSTGEILDFGGNNIYCAPGGQAGVLVGFNGRSLIGFTIPGLALVPSRALFSGDGGVSAAFSADGTRMYVRSVNGDANQTGFVDVFEFDPVTARIGAPGDLLAEPILTFPVGGVAIDIASGWQVHFGIDELALSPDEDKLYVTERNRVAIYDPASGDLTGEINWPNAIIRPTGVTVERLYRQVAIDVDPASTENSVNLKNKHPLPVAVLSDGPFDATSLDDATIRLADPELLLSGGTAVAPTGGANMDVNGDGRPDRVYQFDKQQMQAAGAIGPASTQLLLIGEMATGKLIAGTDGVVIAGAGGGGGKGNGNGNGPKK